MILTTSPHWRHCSRHGVVLLGFLNELAILRVLHLALYGHGDSFLHLIAGDHTLDGPSQISSLFHLY